MSASNTQRDPTRRFSDRVEYYIKSRPRYPRALLDFCREELGLKSTDRVADIGSGTGFLSELFLENGNEVFAVDPNAPMRKAAEATLGSMANFKSIDGTAEATGLDAGSVDFVVAGQAFHWFDRARAREEFRRILRPGGWVVLTWNERRLNDGGFSDAYEEVIRDFQTDLTHVKRQSIAATDSKEMTEFFQNSGYAVRFFSNPQYLDGDGLIARALSSSYLPLPGQPRSGEMQERLQQLFSKFAVGGKVQQDYDTRVFYGRLS